jgi:hypothetical protein
MNNPGHMFLLLALGSIAFDCNGETPAQDPYGPIPAWVRIDHSLLSENTPAQKPADSRFSSITRNLAEPLHAEASPFHPPQSGRIPMADAYRMQERQLSPAIPRQSETPPGAYRPSLEIPGGWKVAMPNARRNVARVLLQHSF